MTTTTSRLQGYRQANVNFVLAIDGYPTLFTISDSAAMLTAWAAEPGFTACRDGLDIIGEISQDVSLFDPRVDAGSLTFQVVDTTAGDLAQDLFRLASSSDYKSWVTADIAPNATSFSCNTTISSACALFPSTGSAWLGHECFTYSGTSTTASATVTSGFYVSERAIAAVCKVNGGTGFAPPAIIEVGVTAPSENMAVAVTSRPRTWYNRTVKLYVHHYEGGAWSTLANALCLWTGRIKSWTDHGDGRISLECRDISERLMDSVAQRAWQADITKGANITASDTGVVVTGSIGASGFSFSDTMTITAGYHSWQEVRDALDAVLDGFTTANISLGLVEFTDEETGDTKLALDIHSTTLTGEAGQLFCVSLTEKVWKFLGWDKPRVITDKRSSYHDSLLDQTVETRAVPYDSTQSRYILEANVPPRIYQMDAGYEDTVSVLNEAGTWQTTPFASIRHVNGGFVPFLCNGAISVGGDIWLVKYASTPSLTLYGKLTSLLYKDALVETTGTVVSDGKPEDECKVRQVIYKGGPAGTLLLELMLSTGATGYNHATYDVLGAGIGLGIPASEIDIPSFLSLDTDAPVWSYWLAKPRKFCDLLNEVCAATARYLVRKNGKLTLARMPSDKSSAYSAVALTESNKAGAAERSSVGYGQDGVINKATFKYLADPVGGDMMSSATVVLGGSTSTYGVRPISMEGPGFADAGPWVNMVVPALAYFQHPPAIMERSYSVVHCNAAPCDLALITDDAMINPVTGTRGVTELPGAVLSTSFDFKSGQGKARVACLPMVNPDYSCMYAPSARVDSTAASGGYVAATRTLTLEAHAYSDTAADADATLFPAGTAIQVTERDPATSASPLTWSTTVSEQTGNTIVTVDALTSWNTSKHYIVELAAVATVDAEARTDYTFIADKDSGSTTFADGDARRYGTDVDADALSSTPVYTNEYERPYDLEDDVGEPLSTHKITALTNAANNFLAYQTRNPVLVCMDPRADCGGATVLTEETICCVARVPVYGTKDRQFRVKAYGHAAFATDTLTLTIYTSPQCIRGTSWSSPKFVRCGYNSTTTSTSSATGTWMADAVITPFVGKEVDPPMTWITITGVAGTEMAYLAGVTVIEEPVT